MEKKINLTGQIITSKRLLEEIAKNPNVDPVQLLKDIRAAKTEEPKKN